MREEFEKWKLDNNIDGEIMYGSSDTSRKHGWRTKDLVERTWNARQPEIDALKAEVERLKADAERYYELKAIDFCVSPNVTAKNADYLLDLAIEKRVRRDAVYAALNNGKE